MSIYNRLPAAYRSAVQDFYRDEDGWWICLDCTGPYILEGYISEYTIHEDTQKEALAEFRQCIRQKPR